MSKKIRYAGEVFSGYNKPKKTPGENKKFAVLVKDKNGNDKIVHFGDPKMGHTKGARKAVVMAMPSAEPTSSHGTTATRRKTRQPRAIGPVTGAGNAIQESCWRGFQHPSRPDEPVPRGT